MHTIANGFLIPVLIAGLLAAGAIRAIVMAKKKKQIKEVMGEYVGITGEDINGDDQRTDDPI